MRWSFLYRIPYWFATSHQEVETKIIFPLFSFCPERALCCRHYGHLWSRSRGLMIWSRSRGLMIWSRRQQGRLSFWLYSVCILSVLVMTVLLYPPYNRQASYKTKISWTMHREKTRLRPTGAISFI